MSILSIIYVVDCNTDTDCTMTNTECDLERSCYCIPGHAELNGQCSPGKKIKLEIYDII